MVNGEETSGYTGNRYTDGVSGAAVPCFLYAAKELSAHEQMRISARLARFPVAEAIADPPMAPGRCIRRGPLFVDTARTPHQAQRAPGDVRENPIGDLGVELRQALLGYALLRPELTARIREPGQRWRFPGLLLRQRPLAYRLGRIDAFK